MLPPRRSLPHLEFNGELFDRSESTDYSEVCTLDSMHHLSFPKLPVLTKVDRRLPEQVRQLFPNTGFVCVQHLLSTTGSLYETLVSLGAKPHNIYVLGKSYSTSRSVLTKLRGMGIHVLENNQQGRMIGFGSMFEHEVQGLWNRCVNDWTRHLTSKME